MNNCKSNLKALNRTPDTLPEGIALPSESRPMLACGSETGNTFTLTDGRKAYVSSDIGDLKDLNTYNCYVESIEKMEQELHVIPEIAIHDMHPDYVSTRYAQTSGIRRLYPIQHHHAHAAACMHENGLNEKVIAVIYDGMGLGDDGTIWGGEFLVCDLENYQRKAHLKQYPLPGSDQATLNPERMAFSCFVNEPELGADAASSILNGLNNDERIIIQRMIEKRFNSPLTSSAGRLFDAVAAMLGFTGKISYPAEAAIELQKMAQPDVKESYSYEIKNWILGFAPMFKEISNDIHADRKSGVMSAMFHNTLATGTVDMCNKIRTDTELDTVVISGGVFYNGLLSSLVTKGLQTEGFNVYSHSLLPPGDVCVSLGQAVIASTKEL